ncbi:MAG TPA: hypothetical protein VGO00_11485, partial [Kofleriaceae bacterium]|nr:hypothetical protein [Kofleriaceae bacterium]
MVFDLLGDATDETRLIRHPCGYSIAVPGHPSITAAPAPPPNYDTVVTLADEPMQLGFRLDALPAGSEPTALAQTLALAYATGRGATAPKARSLGSSITPKGAAAASTLYPVGEQLENLVVLVRPRADGIDVIYMTARYATKDITPIRWAAVRAALLTSQAWDPTAPRTTAPALWPTESTFALPGVTMRFTEAAWAEAQAKAREIGALADDQTAELIQRFVELSNNDDPPLHPQHPYALGLVGRQLAMQGPTS